VTRDEMLHRLSTLRDTAATDLAALLDGDPPTEWEVRDYRKLLERLIEDVDDVSGGLQAIGE
jgi:hypothetical protein